MNKLEFNWFHSAKGGVKLQVLDSQNDSVLAILDTWDFERMAVTRSQPMMPEDLVKYCNNFKNTDIDVNDFSFKYTSETGIDFNQPGVLVCNIQGVPKDVINFYNKKNEIQ